MLSSVQSAVSPTPTRRDTLAPDPTQMVAPIGKDIGFVLFHQFFERLGIRVGSKILQRLVLTR